MKKCKLNLANAKIFTSNDSIDLNNVDMDDIQSFPKDGISLEGEVTISVNGPKYLVGYIGIDLSSGESRTSDLVKKEISKSFDINKGRFNK